MARHTRLRIHRADSMVLPDRITYSSPVGKDVYEKIHALRGSEITAWH